MERMSGNAPLYWWERVGLGMLLCIVIGFGVLTEIRSCFLTSRHTDFGMLVRAGWAVRTGGDIYTVMDDGKLHYPYPATFSIFMAPLADPPKWHDRFGYFPFEVSVALWYTLSIGLLAIALHQFASSALPDAVWGSRRWWYARTMPLYVTVGGVGFSLSRGQVTILLITLMAMSFAAAVRNRRFLGGIWLGLAIGIKMIPAYLILYPLTRFDIRYLLGVAVTLVVWLGLIPVAMWGWQDTLKKHHYFVEHVVIAGTTSLGG